MNFSDANTFLRHRKKSVVKVDTHGHDVNDTNDTNDTMFSVKIIKKTGAGRLSRSVLKT